MRKRLSAGADSLLSIADIARHFSLPESTARFYCKKFARFMPSLGDGRRRRYSPRVLEVMETILEQMRVSRTSSAVEMALDGRLENMTEVAATPEAETPPRGNATPEDGTSRLLEQQTHLMRDIAATLRMLALREEELRVLSDTARKASEENARLREEMWNLRHRLETTEKTQQDDLERLRACVSRLIAQRNNGTGAPSGSKP